MRTEIQNKIDRYSLELRSAKKEEIPALKAEFDAWYSACSSEEKAEMQPYWDDNRRQISEGLKEVRKMIEEVLSMEEKPKRKKGGKVAA